MTTRVEGTAAIGPHRLPPDEPGRRALADEVHARPPAPVTSPAAVSVVALIDTDAEGILAALRTLAADTQHVPERNDLAHVLVRLPHLTVKFERHGEFSTLTFAQPLSDAKWPELGELPSALDALPANWLGTLPGRTIAAADITLVRLGEATPRIEQVAHRFRAELLAGSRVLEDAAWLFTDFDLRADGRTRWLALDAGLGPAQTARLVQRIAEIEVYRMTALLAFPLARAAFPALNALEQRLAGITAATAALQGQGSSAEIQGKERALLDELTGVAAEVERSVAASSFRFSAAEAYWEIVRARVGELREQRIGDLRTLSGFLNRRVAPAIHSCAAAARRQEELSARIERASSLLRTRVDIAREEQNQRLLAAMERRGELSLRLQQTVEGLSIAAITYYVVGLTGYLVKPLRSIRPDLNPDWIIAASVPIIAVLVWRAVEHVRRRVMRG